MTIEKAQKDFNQLIPENGFTLAAEATETRPAVYHRVWKKWVQVAWYGEQEDTLGGGGSGGWGWGLVCVKGDGRDGRKLIRD